MKKNQIDSDRRFFNFVTDGINHPLYAYVLGLKNNKVIHYTWLHGFGPYTMHMNIFIDKIKQKYKNIEGSSDKEIIDNANQIWRNSNEPNR